MSLLNCTTAGMAIYVPSADLPWNRVRLQHLFRRLGFGMPPDRIEECLSKTPSTVVQQLIAEAQNMPLPEPPDWADWTASRYQDDDEAAFDQLVSWSTGWLGDMIQKGFREKMALFWHNHFVTELDTYFCPSWLYQYHKLLQQHALGNFKTFVYEMGKTPAMLVYLNGVQNVRGEPNENYARELFELFTLGENNGYTQTDITEAARALTGWNGFTELCAPIGYLQLAHDPGMKTIFGKTDRFDYDSLHNLLFEERGEQIATFICTKIYRHFVSPTIDEAIVAQMATTFRANDFEIAPVLLQLFQSEHFFDDPIIGTQIKSPLEMMIGIVVEWGIPELDDEVLYTILFLASEMGQRLFNPVDVAGWQEDRTWIDSNKLSQRWQAGSNVVFSIYSDAPEFFRQFAKFLSEDSTDPFYITRVISDHMLAKGFANDVEYDRATAVFKSEVPENYFEDGTWNLDWDIAPVQVALLLNYLVRQPAFQLS
ncbi:MAG: DUF1800 domain-containing protein [Bacteroidota bacterium]